MTFEVGLLTAVTVPHKTRKRYKGWLFFRVEPKESAACQKAFDRAIQQAQLDEKSRQFLRTHKAYVDNLNHDAYLDSYELLYPHEITALADDIFLSEIQFLPGILAVVISSLR